MQPLRGPRGRFLLHARLDFLCQHALHHFLIYFMIFCVHGGCLSGHVFNTIPMISSNHKDNVTLACSLNSFISVIIVALE
jgi:hypothetical protein